MSTNVTMPHNYSKESLQHKQADSNCSSHAMQDAKIKYMQFSGGGIKVSQLKNSSSQRLHWQRPQTEHDVPRCSCKGYSPCISATFATMTRACSSPRPAEERMVRASGVMSIDERVCKDYCRGLRQVRRYGWSRYLTGGDTFLPADLWSSPKLPRRKSFANVIIISPNKEGKYCNCKEMQCNCIIKTSWMLVVRFIAKRKSWTQ